MNGVLIRLTDDTNGRPGYWFRIAFKPALSKLDALRWYPLGQPWMGPPENFDEPEALWRRGALRRYSEHFSEEFIELWGYDGIPSSFVRENAAAVLIYTDSSCWEFYTTLNDTARTIFDRTCERTDMFSVRASLESRGQAFGDAGLSNVWRALQGRA